MGQNSKLIAQVIYPLQLQTIQKAEQSIFKSCEKVDLILDGQYEISRETRSHDLDDGSADDGATVEVPESLASFLKFVLSRNRVL